MKTNCDVEEYVFLTLGEIAECGSYDRFLDLVAEKSGYPLLTEIDVSPAGIVESAGGGPNRVRIKVTGCVEVDGEDKTPEQMKGESYL